MSGDICGTLSLPALSCLSGDTRLSTNLEELAERTDLLLLQNMGPIVDLGSLPFASQYLINVSSLFSRKI